MLSSSAVFDRDGLQISDVRCRHPAGRGRHIELSEVRALVFVRRGCFVRSVDGVESLLDSTVAYAMNPGEEQRFDHPHSEGDDCTTLTLTDDLSASLHGGEPLLGGFPVPVPAWLDLEHRLLLARAGREEDAHELFEHGIVIAASLLEVSDPRAVTSGKPQTVQARRALVDGAREALAAQPEVSLLELARRLAVSPHHLSRIFRQATGVTVSRHRLRLRVREALERLGGGERDLARLAVELGLTDQSHLCRVVRSETGHTPAALRRALAS
jgi:AraC-like DNA-binding protein